MIAGTYYVQIYCNAVFVLLEYCAMCKDTKVIRVSKLDL